MFAEHPTRRPVVGQGRQPDRGVGAPDDWSSDFYSNRFIWTYSRGKLDLPGGTERSQWNQGEDRSVLDVVGKFDPESGFERPGFALQTMAAIEVGQWDAARKHLYVSDDMGHVYRFTDDTGGWEYLGRLDFLAGGEAFITGYDS